MYAYYWKHNEQRWVNPSGTLVGEGWQGTQKLISGGNQGFVSQVYRITDSGALYWYRWSGIPGEGGFWEIVNRGWYGGSCGYQTVQGGGQGRFYAVDGSGRLRWWYHYEVSDGHHWVPSDVACGNIVGQGWM